MELSGLPLEVSELIFSNVVWDGFRPELVETLTSATQCIDWVHERNSQLRELRATARFVDCIVHRLAWKYVHITSRKRAEEFVKHVPDYHVQGNMVRHLFLGDRAGRYELARAPDYTWVSEESGKEWIEEGTLGKLLAVMPNLTSLHVHLPGIHSQIFSSSLKQRQVASPYSLETIRCLSLYDDVNNTPCYEAVASLSSARESLSAFPNLRYLVISESEGFANLDKLVGSSSSQVDVPYAPQLRRITLEKWCPMASDVHLYNLAIYMPWTNLAILRRVPLRMSLAGITPSLHANKDVCAIITRAGSTLTSLDLEYKYHSADDLERTKIHLCATIRDNCQNLEYLTLSFPPPDRPSDAPRPSVCHQLFRAPGSFMNRAAGMLNMKACQIIGYYDYCDGSSRKMMIDASEEVWESQSATCCWSSCGDDSLDHGCLHANMQIHGTSTSRTSLLKRRELCLLPSTLSELSPHHALPPRRRAKDVPFLTLDPHWAKPLRLY
jgi:hypothetical protein